MNTYKEVWGVHPLNDRLQRFAIVRVSDPGRGKSQVCTHVRTRKEADLISASNEMYSALKHMVECHYPDANGQIGAIEECWAAIQAAKTALAKAERGS